MLAASGFVKEFFILLLIAVLVQPWRHSVSQDDATYAFQALSFSRADFVLHPDTMAFVLPQSLLGAVVSQFGSPLVACTLLTWLLFGVMVVLTKRFAQLSLTLVFSLFAVPFWIQYGASFLYEIYVAVFLLLLTAQWRKDGRFLFPLAFLLTVQMQLFVIVPLFFGVTSFFQKRYRAGFALLLGALVGIGVYGLWPHSLMQVASASYLFHQERSWKEMFFCGFQLLLGFGIFLIPLTQWSVRRFGGSLVVLCGCWYAIWNSSLPVLSAGVFFSDYLPRSLAALLIAGGVLGWCGVSDLLPKKWSLMHAPFVAVGCVLLAAYAFRGVNDVRYTMLLVPLVIGVMRPGVRLGSHLGFLIPSMALSIFLNRYQLDTVQARWDLSAQLEQSGADIKSISAGYGHDHFFLESDCIVAASKKVGSLQSPEFATRIWRRIPRVYEDGWVPKYVIKPYQLFGVNISLAVHQSAGQNQAPFRIYHYRSLGLPHALAVFKNEYPQLAWCFLEGKE